MELARLREAGEDRSVAAIDVGELAHPIPCAQGRLGKAITGFAGPWGRVGKQDHGPLFVQILGNAHVDQGGRIGGAKALLASALAIKPIIEQASGPGAFVQDWMDKTTQHGKVGMKIMHKGAAAARIVGSMWTDHDMIKAIGATPGTAPRDGWLVMVKVDDAALWKRIKDGEISAFSIGGKGQRTPIPAA